MGFFSPILAMNSYYSMSTLQRQNQQNQQKQQKSYGDYYSLPRQKFSPAPPPPPASSTIMSGTPVILNVFAPAPGATANSNYCTLQSVHYGTLPIKRTNSIKATSKSSEKSTPGLDQIMKWVKNKREKYKSSRRSSASAVSSSSTLKEAPQGILRNPRRDYANYLDSLPRPYQQQQQQFNHPHHHQQQQQQQQQQLPRRQFLPPTMSLPPTNRQWSTLRRTSDAFYGYDPVFDEDNDDVFESIPQRSFDSYRDYYPTATLERLERYEPSLERSRRSSIEVPVPMLHRYPPSYIEPPIDYSCSSTSSSNGSNDNSPAPASKVRFQFPKPEDIQYINTTDKEEQEQSFSPSTLQKFEKIYQKFKPNFIKKSAKKADSIDSTEDNTPSTSTSASTGSGQLENDDTDSTTSVATIHLPTKIVIEDDEETLKQNEDDNLEDDESGACNNVFFFGETRIDYQCHRVGNNMVVHYTSRKIASNNGKVASKIQRRGVITDIEYGPGIVQKLREKFSKMASTVIETAQISPHAKQKKFPSVDDILSENEQRNGEHKRQEFNDQTKQEQPKPYYYFHHDKKQHHELPSSPPLPSRSQSQPPPKSPPLPAAAVEEIQQQQESPRAVVEKTPLGPISALRAKFEQQAAARAHAYGISRQNFGSRSQSVNTLKQYEARKEVAAAIPKSTESLIHASKKLAPPEKMEEIRFAPKIPEKRPSGFLPPPIPHSQEQQILKNYSDNREINYFGAPKPVRVMDLVSPPADPSPKEYHLNDRVLSTTTTTTNMPPSVHSPASSTASSDQSPPPEEPRLIQHEHEEEEEEAEENESLKDASYEQYRTQALQDDRSNERFAFAAIQRQKMTLTLPIGSHSQQQHPQQQQHHQRMPPMNDVRIGKPGSTPITGQTKLKLPSDNSGISEVQKLLNKFNAIREQKIMNDSPIEEKTPLPTTLPTAIVPPVVQQHQKQQTNNFAYSPNNYHTTENDWMLEEKKQQNIISINIGEEQQQQHQQQREHRYLERDDTTPQQHHHHKQRMAPPPPPPPPLPPRGGTDQQQQQRKSLTSRWLESKQDSDEESVASATEYNVAEQQQHQHMSTTNTISTNFGVGSCHSTKPYGDNEIIDEQTRRSLETMSVVKEEPEEETEDIGSVRLLSRRTLEDDNGIVHRSDFLKSNYPYESSESDEDDHPNAHLAAYGIHRLGIYEAPNASDGNPVRHSLLNLVAEEDIPELLQAMAEECHFVFDDCDRTNMPTTSGIIHTPAKRMERRKQRNVDRICFDDKHPEVFAYVDESAAYEEGEWSEGFPITYEEYKQLVEAANAEAAQQHMDLSNWRMLMEQKFSIQDEQIRALTEQHERDQQHNIENQSTSSSSSSAGSNLATQSKQERDEELGVTSTFSYSSSTPAPLTSCSQPLQMNLRQTDRETSAM